jgi:RNA polymerase sigma-70 factor (ECF subfamily)
MMCAAAPFFFELATLTCMPEELKDEAAFAAMIQGLRNGDPRVAEQFWSQYGDRLQRVADLKLPGGLRHRVAPEDVVQSVCRTFIRRARDGQFQFNDGGGLWGLLCAITLAKVREQTRFHLRQKRGAQREAGEANELTPAIDSAPTPADEAEFADQFRHLLESLNAEERQIVELKLEDHTNDQVAEKLGCSERTVRRLLKQLQARLNLDLDAATTRTG